MRVTKLQMCAWKSLAVAGLLAVLPAVPAKAETLTALHETEILAAITKAQSEATAESGARLEYTLKFSDVVSNSVEVVEPDPQGLAEDLLEPEDLLLPLKVGKYFVTMIAGAHSEALHKLMEDELEDGFSLGVVLGADDRPLTYVRENYFFKNLPVPTAVYPEWGYRLRDAHNAALSLGYKQGRRLLVSKEVRAAFFEDIGARMTNYIRGDYLTDNETWGERTWRTYYHDCASTFRRTHVEE